MRSRSLQQFCFSSKFWIFCLYLLRAFSAAMKSITFRSAIQSVNFSGVSQRAAVSLISLLKNSIRVFCFFFKIFVGACPFVGPLIPLFWTSGDVSSGFQTRVGSALFALGRGICNIRSLRFTSGVTP